MKGVKPLVMLEQIYKQYSPFATRIMEIYRYLREDREEFRVSGKLESDSLAIDDLMELCTMDSFEEAITKVEHIQRLMLQLHEAGYLDRSMYESASIPTDAFRSYLVDVYGKMKAKKEEPIPQDLYEQAVQLAREMGQISVAMLQRRLRTGYAQAGRIIDLLEQSGIIGPARGAQPHKTL